MNLLVNLVVNSGADPSLFRQSEQAQKRLRAAMGMTEKKSAKTAQNMQRVARNTRSAESAAFQMGRKLDLLNRSATKLRNSFLALAGGGIVAAAMGSFVGKLAAMNDEFKITQVRLAGMLVQGGSAKTFAEGRVQAKSLQKTLAFEAAASPGTSQEFTNAFLRIQNTTGKGIKDSIALTKGLLVAGDASRGPVGRQNILNDLQQVLTGPLAARTAQDMYMFLQSKGVSANKFNALPKGEARLKVIAEAIAKLGPEIEALKQTFQTQSTTLQSYIQQLTIAGSGKFVDGVTKALGGTNSLVETHFQDLARVLEGFAPTIAAIVTSGAALFSVFGILATSLAILAAGVVLLSPLISGIGGAASGLAGMVGSTGILGALGLGALGTAGAGTLLAGAGTAVVGTVSAVGPGMAVAALVAGLAAALAALAVAIGTVLLPFVALLGLITTAFAGLMVFIVRVPKALEYLSVRFETVLFQVQQLYYAALNLGAGLYMALEPMLLWAGDWMYNGLTTALDLTARFIRFIIDSGTTIGLTLSSLQTLLSVETTQNPFEKLQRFQTGVALGKSAAAQLGIALDVWRALPRFPGEEEGTSKFKTDDKPDNNFNGDIYVEIKADTIEDPQRAAAAWETILGEIVMRRTGARRTNVRER